MSTSILYHAFGLTGIPLSPHITGLMLGFVSRDDRCFDPMPQIPFRLLRNLGYPSDKPDQLIEGFIIQVMVAIDQHRLSHLSFGLFIPH